MDDIKACVRKSIPEEKHTNLSIDVLFSFIAHEISIIIFNDLPRLLPNNDYQPFP